MLALKELINRSFELACTDGRKSFYGKARVLEDDTTLYLQSYDTIVCYWNDKNKTFIRCWDGYSTTTMRHINSFMDYIGLSSCGGKRWWDKLETDKQYTISELLNVDV